MENDCVWEWLGDDWHEVWEEPPSPCPVGYRCRKPVGAGTRVGQTVVTDCVPINPGEG